jgi:hypothetical protein
LIGNAGIFFGVNLELEKTDENIPLALPTKNNHTLALKILCNFGFSGIFRGFKGTNPCYLTLSEIRVFLHPSG